MSTFLIWATFVLAAAAFWAFVAALVIAEHEIGHRIEGRS